MSARWSTSAIRWWPIHFVTSGSGSRWFPGAGVFSGWDSNGYRQWLTWRPELSSLSIVVDDVVWRIVTAFESVALVSMLCFFFLFCGCTV